MTVADCNRRYHSLHRTERNAQARQWVADHPNVMRERDWARRGIDLTYPEYLAMLEAQDYKCALAKLGVCTDGTLHAEHNHRTGKVRGLTCSRHNSALAAIDADNPDVLEILGDYIARG